MFLMNFLVEQGFNVTVGVVNLLDSDCEVANTLGVPVVSEAPFSPITESTYSANLELIRKAGVLVLTDVPFGYANLKNLEAARWALEQGIATVIIEETPIRQKDFTKGEAGELWQKLREAGATFVSSVSEALSLINKLDAESDLWEKRRLVS